MHGLTSGNQNNFRCVGTLFHTTMAFSLSMSIGLMPYQMDLGCELKKLATQSDKAKTQY